MGSMQNFPVSRRNDRGYSSDIDSVNRPGRGGQRGRGRGRGNPRYHQGNNLHNNIETTSYNNVDSQQKKPNNISRGRGNGGGHGGSSSSANGPGGRPTRGGQNERRPPRSVAPSSTSSK